MCFCLQYAISRYGVGNSVANGQLMLSKFIPPLIASISDPNSQVRDTAMSTLVEIYKHVGEKLRQDISKKHTNIPTQKLQTLFAKFDEIANSGELLPSAKLANRIGISGDDEIDFKMNLGKASVKRATSAPPVKRNALTTPKIPSSATTSKSGAADEEMFMNSFEDVPRVQIFSSKDLEQELTKIKDTCSDPSMSWEKRTESLRRLRSLLIAGASEFDEFNSFLKPLELPFQVSVKDLRSQVVREACITIAYLSQRIGIRFENT
jgi:CLIP-associating protein 1/2